MESDHLTTVADLRELDQSFVDERDWRHYHNPKNLALSIAIEAAEIMERFQCQHLYPWKSKNSAHQWNITKALSREE